MESLAAPELPQQFDGLLKDPADLIAAIVQDISDGKVLMMAWMNREALIQTILTKKATYWSRSRNQLWVKGESSGHTQHVKSISLDCDGDALLLQVEQIGVACHTGQATCFHVAVVG